MNPGWRQRSGGPFTSRIKGDFSMITVDQVREMALSFPESKEMDHWGKPSFRANNKIFAVIQEDGVTLTIKTAGEDRTIYTSMAPEIYSVPESFSNLNYMHVHLNLVDPKELSGLLEKAWRSVAPKKIVKAYDEGKPNRTGG
jgi:hypothetical protein